MKKWFRKIGRWLLKALLYSMLGSVVWVLLYRFLDPPITPLMVIRYFQSDEETELVKDWVDLENMPAEMPLAVIAGEDQLFPFHSGFDMAAIEKAMKNNLSDKKITVKGGSTISQQTAKNVFLWPNRSWLRKGLEVWFTFWVESLWSKERILEVYLNVIEMGNGLYGVEAASQKYFHKGAHQLKKQEMAMIAAILPSPRKYSATNPSNYVRRRQQWIIGQMWNLGPHYLDEIIEREKEE